MITTEYVYANADLRKSALKAHCVGAIDSLVFNNSDKSSSNLAGLLVVFGKEAKRQ